ncbi:MAG: hypothetical protein FJ387_19350 [Verrucomicrobia bacterium]|nr:hypothetical protein [Verrucomicrobiota bacterium]
MAHAAAHLKACLLVRPGRPAAGRLGLLLLAVWGLVSLEAAPGRPGLRLATTRSRTGQFVVHSPYLSTPSLGQRAVGGATNLIALQPDAVAVACERIKQGVLATLGLPDRWRGRIHVWLKPEQVLKAPIAPAATRYADGWAYDLPLPGQLEPARLVRAVVEALLTELAHRSGGPHPPELPVWLIEGLVAHLLEAGGPEVVPTPSPLSSRVGPQWGQVQPETRSARPDELWRAQQLWFQAHPPLSFNQLALPTEAHLAPPLQPAYRASARLFLSELRRLPGGTSALAGLVGRLSFALNWQTAFLASFHQHFTRLVEVEKWWAVVTDQITGRNSGAVWSSEQARLRLDELLWFVVETRQHALDPPQRSKVPLAQVLEEWHPAARDQVLRLKQGQLQIFLRHAPAELQPLARAYADALAGFLAPGPPPRAVSAKARPAEADRRQRVRELARQWHALDQQRAALGHPGLPSSP